MSARTNSINAANAKLISISVKTIVSFIVKCSHLFSGCYSVLYEAVAGVQGDFS